MPSTAEEASQSLEEMEEARRYLIRAIVKAAGGGKIDGLFKWTTMETHQAIMIKSQFWRFSSWGTIG